MRWDDPPSEHEAAAFEVSIYGDGGLVGMVPALILCLLLLLPQIL